MSRRNVIFQKIQRGFFDCYFIIAPDNFLVLAGDHSPEEGLAGEAGGATIVPVVH